MPRKKKVVEIASPQPGWLDSPEKMFELIPSRDPDLIFHLIEQVMGAIWLPATASKEDRDQRIRAALAAVRELKPRDGPESLLATQMVATHDAAMEWLRRAAQSNLSLQGADLCLRQATKLLSLWLKQLDALNRNRNKGQQKVTVEHVQVQSGGQAIVGHVEQHKSSK